MKISNGSVGFAIAGEDRPYIEFERTLNRGTRKRAEKKDDKGKVTRAAHPGEFKEVWRKALISHRAPFDPYTWATAEWALHRVEVGCTPVGYGNMDKLPASYPREWRQKLDKCIAAVASAASANKRVMELEAKLESKEIKDAAPAISTEEGSKGSDGQGAKAPLGKKRAAANAA